MRAVNLLPKDDGRSRSRKKTNAVALVGLVGGTVVVTAMACMFILARGDVASKQDELAAKQTELNVTPEPPKPAETTNATLADARLQRAQALTAALKVRVAWDRVLRQFATVLPSDVWLTSINAKAPTSASTMAPSGAGGFMIVGRTYSHAAVARLLSRLQVVPELTNVTLQMSRRTSDGRMSIVDFTIVADVRAPGATA